MQFFPRSFVPIFSDLILFSHLLRMRWHAVAQSIEALLYKVAVSIPDGVTGFI
jgi:hypothetical protein